MIVLDSFFRLPLSSVAGHTLGRTVSPGSIYMKRYWLYAVGLLDTDQLLLYVLSVYFVWFLSTVGPTFLCGGWWGSLPVILAG